VFLILLVGISMQLPASEISLKPTKDVNVTIPPRSPVYIPVRAFLEEDELLVIFEYSVGTAVIAIEDADGNTVYSVTTDTSSELEMSTMVDNLAPGNYLLVISYGSMILHGNFSL